MARKTPRMTHVDRHGAARMVDVSGKSITSRTARASAKITMSAETLRQIISGKVAKGDVLQVARIAGIQAAKRTCELIPLCHPLPIEAVQIDFEKCGEGQLVILAATKVRARTGVEMEALAAATLAALTVYDMCKSFDRAMIIGPIQLETKAGGRSGSWRRQAGGSA